MHSIPQLLLAIALFALQPATALAQPKSPVSTDPASSASVIHSALRIEASTVAPAISAQTLNGKPFKLSALKGKVVLVMFWSTDCAVCRDKMPELRTNYEGWAGKPFEVVAISTDPVMQNVLDYERIVSSTTPLKQRFVQIWAGSPGYQDNLGKHAMLPAAYLLNKDGKVVERYVGRIPAEAWDKIADLL